MRYPRTGARGVSLVEALIVSAILSLFFSGLFAGIVYSIELLGTAKAKMTALSIASDQMEYIRSLSYDSVGTVAGIPSGSIPQLSTTTMNQKSFSVRTLIAYVDDPADGVGGSDANLITTDYKHAKVTVSWGAGSHESLSLQSNIIPRSIETNIGGGTLRVNVFDANVAPLPGASVRLVNNYLTPAIDTTRTTDATGVVLFGGAPAGSEYEIFVTGSGYTTDQTYRATTSLPFPTVLPISILAADISTMNFFIDRESRIDLSVYTDRSATSTEITWDDVADFATTSQIVVVGNEVRLEESGGVYAGGGTAIYPFAPSQIETWDAVTVASNVPLLTNLRLRFYAGTSTFTLIPDADLPGNAAGFTSFPIDLTALDAGNYSALGLGLALETSSSTLTPAVSSVTVSYIEDDTPAGALPFTLLGTKTIGTDLAGDPVYKHNYSGTLTSGGIATIDPIEWDTYTVTIPGYDIIASCPGNPLEIIPNTTIPLTVVLGANTLHSLLVTARESDGTPVSGATIEITDSSGTTSLLTDSCGQAYFGGLAAEPHTISASKTGYGTISVPDFPVSGDTYHVIEW